MRLLPIAGLCLAAFATPALAETVTLGNGLWQVSLDPANLAIDATPAGEGETPVSAGVDAHAVTDLAATGDHADWTWDGGAYRVAVALDGADLTLAITANAAGELAFIRQPAAAMGAGLILPLAEGHYVPAGDAVWRDFLTGPMSSLNTTEDLSLPLWGTDHGTFALHWVLTNPFDNTLAFSRDGDGVALAASHFFTSLDPTAPLTAILHLGDDDLLAGAKRYRDWLVAGGAFETLAQKIAARPADAGMIGATQIYLWGGGLIAPKDVADWRGFAALLRGDDPFAAALRGRFESDAVAALTFDGAHPFAYQERALTNAFDDALNTLARTDWLADPTDSGGLVAAYAGLRQQVTDVFGGVLAGNAADWGDGVSTGMMASLQASGLTRLWIGFGEGWEPGLWHPEAVAAAAAAGYLVAPYDSYQTALPADVRLDWATAHLGDAAYAECAIVLADGSLRLGFQQTGHYTDPDCVRPILEDRVAAIADAAGFNSWFIDSYAAGMVFDSYRPGAPLTQAQNAAANVAAIGWIDATLGLPTGSEDGNAVTAGGLLFAQGMQTPVIGWGDPAMQDDRDSPYFLGAWYPPEAPAIFFRPVPLEDVYAHVYFDPAGRLPLYQAAFHDAVITTDHWTFDALKLPDVAVAREIARLLYDLPALYNLGPTTLDQRLPAIVAQDAFFRPLHQRLATQALTGFAWLTPDRTLQQTIFADGTRLVANFAGVAQTADGQSYPGHSVTALVPGEAAETYGVADPD